MDLKDPENNLNLHVIYFAPKYEEDKGYSKQSRRTYNNFWFDTFLTTFFMKYM